MTNTKNPITPTPEEKELADHLAQAVCFLKQFVEAEEGEQAFIDLMVACRDQAYEILEKEDLSKADAVTLYHDMCLGIAVVAYHAHLVEVERIRFDDVMIDQFCSDERKIDGMAACAKLFQLMNVRGKLCGQEIKRRFSQVDSSLACFISLLIPDRETFEATDSPYLRAHPALVSHVRSMIPDEDFKGAYKVETIYNALRGPMRQLLVASEIHTTEHDNEKKSTINEAISVSVKNQLKKIETKPTQYLYQLAAILNGEAKWEGKKNPLRRFPQRIKNQFINLVEKQVSHGKHWSPPNPKHRREMIWGDAPLHPESDESLLKIIPSDSDPETEVCDKIGNEGRSEEDVIHEIEATLGKRDGELARIFFEADEKNKKRPTQSELAEHLDVTDRTVRNDLQGLRVFLEKKIRDREKKS